MKIGIVDTTFSRVNMGEIAISELKTHYPKLETSRRTVPGIKDLAVECKRLLEGDKRETQNTRRATGNREPAAGCDIVLALGMVGGAPIDTQCAHEASLGIQQAKLMANRHIVEVFVHENEAWSEEEFRSICENRIRKHVHNAVMLVKDPEMLVQKAGMGVRQGKEDEGPVSGDGKIRLGIVVAKFNEEITGMMREKALEIARAGGAEAELIEVPGVFDIPLVMKKLLMDKKIHAGVALGAVVKGETAHDEVITKEAARRLAGLSLEFNKPVTLGIIGYGAGQETAETRAGSYAKHSTESAIGLVKVLRGRTKD
jgi:riboflavin synthase